MKITLKSVADLRDYFGREPVEIELAEGAPLQSVLEAIETRWGDILPPYIWDREKIQFRGPILLLVDRKVQQDLAAPLAEGQEVTIMKALAGG
jgi:molybdopterin converting factor small subunit